MRRMPRLINTDGIALRKVIESHRDLTRGNGLVRVETACKEHSTWLGVWRTDTQGPAGVTLSISNLGLRVVTSLGLAELPDMPISRASTRAITRSHAIRVVTSVFKGLVTARRTES